MIKKKTSIASGYQARLALAKKAAQALESKRGSFWKPQAGTNLLRFLPSLREDELFYVEMPQHFIPWGGENQNGWAYPCTIESGSCLLCDFSGQLIESDSPTDQETGKHIEAKSRYLYNVLDLKNPERGPQVWANQSMTVIGELLAAYGENDFTDPDKGHNVEVVLSGKGRGTKYTVRMKLKASPLGDKTVLKNRADLHKFAPKASKEDIKAVMAAYKGDIRISGTDDDEDPALSLPCFGKKYKKLEACPTCPVKKRCKVKYRSRQAAKEVQAKQKASVGA